MPSRQQYTRSFIPTPADSSGASIATISPDRGAYWHVTQVSVTLKTAPLGSACELRKNGAFLSDLIATGDEAVEPPAIDLQLGDVLTVEWSGLTPGQQGEVTAVYDDVIL